MLTRRMQIQAIADALAGQPPAHPYRDVQFADPWRTCWRVINGAPGLPPSDAVLTALKNLYPHEQERNGIIGAILSARPGLGSLLFPNLAEVAATLRPITWLWQDWIPKGMLSLLGAQPGTGKSLLALDLARRLIHNMTWPDGTPISAADAGRPAVYVDGECVPQIISERARSWAVDMTRLYPMLPSFDQPVDFSTLQTQETLIEMIYSARPAVIIVDSLGSINSKGENAVDDVRDILNFFNTVASEFDVAMLLIHHLRKRPSLPLLPELTFDDFRGSSHIIAMARSVLGLSHVTVGPESDPNGPRKLQILKTNLVAYPPPLGMELVKLHPSGVIPRYGEAPQPYSATETKTDDATSWLIEFLGAGPARPRDIIDAADAAGYSRRTIYRARTELEGRIVTHGGPRNPNSEWALSEIHPQGKNDDD